MINHITFGALNKNNELDVAATIQDDRQIGNTNIILMPNMTLDTAKKILAVLAENGLLTECEEENGQKMYALTEKGKQLDREAKRRMLEDGGCYDAL